MKHNIMGGNSVKPMWVCCEGHVDGEYLYTCTFVHMYLHMSGWAKPRKVQEWPWEGLALERSATKLFPFTFPLQVWPCLDLARLPLLPKVTSWDASLLPFFIFSINPLFWFVCVSKQQWQHKAKSNHEVCLEVYLIFSHRSQWNQLFWVSKH